MPPLRLRVVTNIPGVEPFCFSADYDTLVSELKALVAVELIFGDHSAGNSAPHSALQNADPEELVSRMKLTLRGSSMTIDEETLLQRLERIYGKGHIPYCASAVSNGSGDNDVGIDMGASNQDVAEEKLFVSLISPVAKTSRPTAAVPPMEDEEAKAVRHRRVEQQMQMMEPMIQMMAANPSLLTSMSPELGRLFQQHPEAAREFSNPETLRDMFRAGVDPEARRDMDRAMQSQLSQIQNIPGGMGMLENMMGSVQRDLERPGPRTAADMTEASEERSMPTAGASSNTRALPNPWRQQAPSQSSYQQVGSPFGGHANQQLGALFGNGGVGMPHNVNGGGFGMPYILPSSAISSGILPTTVVPQSSSGSNTAVNSGGFVHGFPEVNASPNTTHHDSTTSTAALPSSSPSRRERFGAELGVVREMGIVRPSDDHVLELLERLNGDIDEVVIALSAEGDSKDS